MKSSYPNLIKKALSKILLSLYFRFRVLIFSEAPINGVYEIVPEKFEDERGFFARFWDKAVFEEKKLDSRLVQCSISFNKKKGTVRGMHYQDSPYEETKVVRCTKGSIYDVVLDLRKNSKTFKQWFGIELNSNEYKQFYIPKGIAHGFQTLEDNTEIFYQIGEYHRPELYRGVRYNDPSFNIKWPLEITNISKKDASFPDFKLT